MPFKDINDKLQSSNVKGNPKVKKAAYGNGIAGIMEW
jgi:hypothetical protein